MKLYKKFKSLKESSFLSDSLLTFVFKIANYLSILFISIILKNILEDEAYGFFVLLEKIVFILTILIVFGQDRIIIKYAVKTLKISTHDYTNYSISLTNIFLLFTLTLPILILIIILSNNLEYNNWVILVFLLSIFPSSVSFLNAAILISKRRNWMGSISKQIIKRIIFLILITLSFVFGFIIQIKILCYLFLFSAVIELIFSYLFLKKIKFDFFRINILSDKKKIISNLNHGSPFLLNSLIFILSQQVAFYFLAFFNQLENIAYYDIAFKISSLCLIPLNVTIGVMSSRVGYFFHKKDYIGVDKLILRVNSYLRLFGFIYLIFIIIFGNKILNIWDLEGQVFYFLVIILTFSQFLDLSFGHVGEYLKLMGLEKELAKISIYYLIINTLLSLFFSYLGDIIGLGISFLVSTFIFNLLKERTLYKRAGISAQLFKFKLN